MSDGKFQVRTIAVAGHEPVWYVRSPDGVPLRDPIRPARHLLFRSAMHARRYCAEMGLPVEEPAREEEA